MSKYLPIIVLAWFLIAIDPKSLSAPHTAEKLPPYLGQFSNHGECDTIAGLLRISRPDWLVSCVYSIYDFKFKPPVGTEEK
jgi:hypothetical protein